MCSIALQRLTERRTKLANLATVPMDTKAKASTVSKPAPTSPAHDTERQQLRSGKTLQAITLPHGIETDCRLDSPPLKASNFQRSVREASKKAKKKTYSTGETSQPRFRVLCRAEASLSIPRSSKAAPLRAEHAAAPGP
jgi:hypothetical protein